MDYSNIKKHNSHSRRRQKKSVLPIVILILVIIIIALVFVIKNNMAIIEGAINNNVQNTISSGDIDNFVDNKNIPSNIKSAKLVSDYSESTVVYFMDTVKFGSYPQSDISGTNKEEIEWIVLERQDNKALLFSKFILDCKCYNNEFKDVTWETCDLRKWLNSDFYNKAFNDSEKSIIKTTNVVNNDNAEYKTSGGNDTNDKVFCLSIDEIRKYFGNGYKETDGYRMGENVATKGTDYARNVENNGSKLWAISEEEWYQWNSCYWLRSPGYFQNCSSSVNETGYLDISNIFQGVSYCDYGVRPAIWIEW